MSTAPITISAIIPCFEDISYLKLCILSILDYVNEIIVIDNTNDPLLNVASVIRDVSNNRSADGLGGIDKIKLIRLTNMDSLDVVMNMAISSVASDFVLRWDSDFLAFGPNDNNRYSIGNLIKMINDKVTAGYDGIYLWYPNIFGDIDHVRKGNEVKTTGYIMRKNMVNYTKSTRFAYEISFDKNGKYFYSNNPDSDPYFFVAMTNCKSTAHILYNAFKSEYWKWMNTMSDVASKLSFRYFFERILGKDYDSSLKWTEATLCDNVQRHNFSLPKVLEVDKHISDPNFKIRYDTKTYRDYCHYGRINSDGSEYEGIRNNTTSDDTTTDNTTTDNTTTDNTTTDNTTTDDTTTDNTTTDNTTTDDTTTDDTTTDNTTTDNTTTDNTTTDDTTTDDTTTDNGDNTTIVTSEDGTITTEDGTITTTTTTSDDTQTVNNVSVNDGISTVTTITTTMNDGSSSSTEVITTDNITSNILSDVTTTVVNMISDVTATQVSTTSTTVNGVTTIVTVSTITTTTVINSS